MTSGVWDTCLGYGCAFVEYMSTHSATGAGDTQVNKMAQPSRCFWAGGLQSCVLHTLTQGNRKAAHSQRHHLIPRILL